MTDWMEYAKLAGGFVGALGLATIAKLYHDKVVAGKETELLNKDAEIDRIRADLARAEARLKNTEAAPGLDQGNLARLCDQLNELVERLARTINVQAASLYIPVYTARDDGNGYPRAFAFVAVYNIDPGAAAAIMRMKVVEAWTVVGECWAKDTVIVDNELQANTRHVASYDKESGFKPLHTLLAPVRWQNRQVGVIQLFNKMLSGKAEQLHQPGFDGNDRKQLSEELQDTTDTGLAGRTHYFLSNPDRLRILGLQDEINVENAVIMFVDLTRSSALFDDLGVIDAARLVNRFIEHVYLRTSAYNAVVDKFNGDGTLIRFHYGEFDPAKPASNPAFRAICAAAELVDGFAEFKSQRWHDLASDVREHIRLRVSIALGPVISTNLGPRQFQFPTVVGSTVNRSAKMISYAPRDRSVVLVDDNTRRALRQIDREYSDHLRKFDHWADPLAAGTASLAGHEYFEASVEHFTLAAARARRTS